jgi:hypothetical protein
MNPNTSGYTAGVLVARSIGFGFLSGAVLGVAGLIVAAIPWALGSLQFPSFPMLLLLLYGGVMIALCAAAIGSFIGTVVGLWCGAVLVVVGRRASGDRRAVRRVAGVATGSPFVVLAVLAVLAWDNGTAAYLGGWLLAVAAMAAATGAAIAPHVVGGPADRLAQGHSCFRHCRFIRSVQPV